MGRRTSPSRAVRIDTGGWRERPEELAVEEPLEIRVNGEAVNVTMRTPGNDIDLALGWLVAEGVVRSRADVRRSWQCADDVVEVALRGEGPRPRRTVTSSACGICGRDSVDDALTRSPHRAADDPHPVTVDVLLTLPDRLRAVQRVFDRTGGLHAAGLFTVAGELLVAREDVGRHNAVDKVVGWAVRERGLPLPGTVLMVSGRAGFELVQKAHVAGITTLAAVSAPSSLAVELARDAGMTLVGFLRGSGMNAYAGVERLEGTHGTQAAG